MTTAALSSGLELEHDTYGSADDAFTLRAIGFTAQITSADEAFCQRLADGEVASASGAVAVAS